jgi:hypothetical protein
LIKTTNKSKNVELRVENITFKHMKLNNVEKLELHKINNFMKKRGKSF